MLQIKHHVPGRVRFQVDRPRSAVGADGAETAALGLDGVAAVLRRQPGVRQVRLNPACGSLVLHYDPARTSAEALREAALARPPAVSVNGLAQLVRGWRWLSPAPVLRKPVAGCRLCRLQLRIARWLTRSTLRCWWQEWRRGGDQAKAPHRQRPLVATVSGGTRRLPAAADPRRLRLSRSAPVRLVLPAPARHQSRLHEAA
jgi:hypothetical protein